MSTYHYFNCVCVQVSCVETCSYKLKLAAAAKTLALFSIKKITASCLPLKGPSHYDRDQSGVQAKQLDSLQTSHALQVSQQLGARAFGLVAIHTDREMHRVTIYKREPPLVKCVSLSEPQTRGAHSLKFTITINQTNKDRPTCINVCNN